MQVNRLPGGDSFTAVFDEGTSIAGRFVVLHHLSKSDGPARVGFAAGKRLGKAVQRNRMKRRLREAFRRLEVSICAADLVFVARAASAEADFRHLKREMAELMSAAGIHIDPDCKESEE